MSVRDVLAWSWRLVWRHPCRWYIGVSSVICAQIGFTWLFVVELQDAERLRRLFLLQEFTVSPVVLAVVVATLVTSVVGGLFCNALALSAATGNAFGRETRQGDLWRAAARRFPYVLGVTALIWLPVVMILGAAAYPTWHVLFDGETGRNWEIAALAGGFVAVVGGSLAWLFLRPLQQMSYCTCLEDRFGVWRSLTTGWRVITHSRADLTRLWFTLIFVGAVTGFLSLVLAGVFIGLTAALFFIGYSSSYSLGRSLGLSAVAVALITLLLWDGLAFLFKQNCWALAYLHLRQKILDQARQPREQVVRP